MQEDLLIAQLKIGDAAAFKELVTKYNSVVYNTSIGIVQHAEDAEDITQDVFAEVFQSIRSFKGNATLRTWIYRITVSRSLELLRKNKRHKRSGILRSLFKKDSLEEALIIPSFHHPGIQLENKERAAVLFAALNKLPENQKTAFVLHKTEGLSYQEIAEIMNLSLSAVESLMVRAKQKLQQLLRDYYEKNEK